MSSEDSASTAAAERLAIRLSRSPRVAQSASRNGTSVSAESWQIATALCDIEDAANRLFRELLPRLLSSDSQDESVEDVLNDIGEEYRHILYHILDTKMYDYIVPPP